MKQEATIVEMRDKNLRVHQLKTVEPYYSEVFLGNKTFEVRKFDRDYQLGDVLQLIKYDPETKKKGEFFLKRISYMLTDSPYVPEGYIILGIKDVKDLNLYEFLTKSFETKAVELLYKWFHGLTDDEMSEFKDVLEELLADVKHSLYS